VTNREDPREEIWRDYNQCARVVQRIEELKSDLAADDFCLKVPPSGIAREAAFLSILRRRSWVFNRRREGKSPPSDLNLGGQNRCPTSEFGFSYHAVPGNLDSLGVFRERVTRLWRAALLRRSQKHRLPWTRMHI
jgi:hypothetical protein